MQNGEVRCAQSSGTTGVKESFCSLGLDDNLIHLMSLITATKKGIFFLLQTASVFSFGLLILLTALQ